MKKDSGSYKRIKIYCYIVGLITCLAAFFVGVFLLHNLEKDEKKDSYNPLRYLQTDDEQEYETLCRLMMTSMLSECAKSFERLPILLYADILRNIIYSGVWSKYEYIQLKKKKRKK